MPDPDGIVRQIRRAEAWLRWARNDCRRGDIRSAVLRLLLAEAEIRHAREAGTSDAAGPAAPGRSWRLPLAMLGAAAALVIVVAAFAVVRSEFSRPVAGWQAARPTRLHAAPSAQEPLGVVQLDTGRLLTMIETSPSDTDAEGSPTPWGARVGGRFFDGPVTHFEHFEPALLGEPASLTAPADPAHLSSTF